jgi:hypothetical protein
VRSDLTTTAIAGGAILYVLLKLLDGVLSRLGARLADWLLPSDRPSTYRVAVTIARIAVRVAPRWSAVRTTAVGAVADIEEMRADPATRDRPLSMALSLVGPAAWQRAWMIVGGAMVLVQAGAFVLLLFVPLANAIPMLLFADVAINRENALLSLSDTERQGYREFVVIHSVVCAAGAVATLALGHPLLALAGIADVMPVAFLLVYSRTSVFQRRRGVRSAPRSR